MWTVLVGAGAPHEGQRAFFVPLRSAFALALQLCAVFESWYTCPNQGVLETAVRMRRGARLDLAECLAEVAERR